MLPLHMCGILHALREAYPFTVACLMFHGAENSRLLSKLGLDCGCHGLHTGRWVGTARLCHVLKDVEDEQHFIFDCPAYS